MMAETQARAIAREAYIYFYPLVTMDVTRRQMTNVEAGKMFGRGPMNSFTHMRTFPPPEVKVVVRPNFDTLYSSAWVDLTGGPVVVSAPDTAGRYYMHPMLDMWTDVFAAPGKRTTGTGPGNFALVPPGWHGDLPKSVQRIDASTPYVWIIGRTQTNGPRDYAAVHKVQDGYRLTPLSRWGKPPATVPVQIDPTVDMQTPPLEQVNSMPARKYFSYAADLLKANPPHITDQPIIARMKRIGLEAGKSFESHDALEEGARDGLKAMQAKVSTLGPVVNGWQMNTESMGVYGTSYLRRAIVAMVGLGANLPEDAIYPLNIGDSTGAPLTGVNRYVLTFKRAELPPADAFWSVTLYDADGFPVVNNLNRSAIGDRDELRYDADGSLAIHIQPSSPGKDRETNWLPAPSGPFTLTMRVYAPRSEALDGRWAPPPVTRLS